MKEGGPFLRHSGGRPESLVPEVRLRMVNRFMSRDGLFLVFWGFGMK